MRTYIVGLGLLVAACGDDGGSTSDANNNNADAKVFRDAPPTTATEVTISGTANVVDQTGSTPTAGVMIAAYRNSNETTPIAMTTTDSQGNYSLTIQTMGESLDGFLKATLAGDYKTTYVYPPYPLMEDFGDAAVMMVTSDTYELLHTLTTETLTAGTGAIGLIVTDGTSPVQGATVSSTPTATDTHYNELVGSFVVPTAGATSTYTDGVAYMFNLPPGQVTVSATKAGSSFASHSVKVWADNLTTTVIVPP